MHTLSAPASQGEHESSAGDVLRTTRLTQNNVTLLAIVLIIPNGIEESLSPHSLAPDIAFKEQIT